MPDLPQHLRTIAELIRKNGSFWLSEADAARCVEAAELIDRLPKDANGTTYTHGDVLRLTTDPTLRAEAVVRLVPLDDCGLASYCTLAGAWAKVDSTEQAAKAKEQEP
jgi:hypothetical protein